MKHEPVLVNEVIELLVRKRGGVYIDATVGSGGHASAILKSAGVDSKLLGIDRDSQALERSRRRLCFAGERAAFEKSSFADIGETARARGFEDVDGIIFDLGVSSEQLESGTRGFSFSARGPLDMRMDMGKGITAREIVNSFSAADLEKILVENADEPRAKRIARAIVRAREKQEIADTLMLAEIVTRAAGGRRGRIHPATRTFQALRMHVNGELDAVENGLKGAAPLVGEGGRLAVISFHSREDRIVKNFFRRHAGVWRSLESGGRELVFDEPRFALVNKKVIRPGNPEVRANPRARSAKLRVAERIVSGSR